MRSKLVRFTLRLATSEIQHVQGHQKSEMHRMTDDRPQIELKHKHPKHNKYLLPLTPNFWFVSLHD